MPAVRGEGAIRREQPAERCIPYAAQIADSVVRLTSGDYLQVLKLGGASFESADDADLNNWHERLNVLWRNVASPNVALWTHTVRRRVRMVTKPATPGMALGMNSPARDTFADALASQYEERLSGETLMANELYLSIVYRPA